MLEGNQAIQEVSLLEQLRLQRDQFITQRDFSQNNLNQLIGAIHACDVMIKAHEKEAKKVLSQDNSVDQGNGKADEQEQEQTA